MKLLRKIALLLTSCFFFLLSAEQALADESPLSQELITKINQLVDQDAERLTDIFKDLHQHPELAFTEQRTAAIVAKELRQLGYSVTEGIGKTGVVGVLKNGEGPTLWFRADMDANAVREETGLPYASVAKQRLPDGSESDVMHACGHDAHVTWMLGLAKTMATMKADWAGTLVVYAQPAEEVGTGAQTMRADKLFERGLPMPDYALGVHTAPGPVGFVASSPGVRMAGTDQLDILFSGVGGHGSTPQMTIDPVLMSAQAILAYQTIISRNLDPQASAVISVGAIEAGRDNNVIPSTSLLKLNLRWFSEDVRQTMLQRIDEVNQGVAIAAGVSAEKMPKRTMKGNASPLVNDAKLIAKINPSLELLLGKGKLIDSFPAVMGSEDFQELYKNTEVPYAFLLIGVAPVEQFSAARAVGKPFPYSNHNPDFFVDLASIPIGVKVNTVSALSFLKK